MRWRKFLQKPSEEVDSYVVVDIPTKKQDYAMELKIADCTHRVQLWFPWATPDKVEISRKKIAILQEALDKLEEGLDKLGS